MGSRGKRRVRVRRGGVRLARGVAAIGLAALLLAATPGPGSTPAEAPAPPAVGAPAHYLLSWGAIPVARGWLEQYTAGDEQRMDLQVRTGPVLRWIYDLAYRGSARVRAADGLPLESRFVQDRNGRHKEVRMHFAPGALEVTETSRKPGREARTKERVVPLAPGDLDPFAFLLQVQTAWQQGEVRRYRVWSSRDRWEVELTCVGERALDGDAAGRHAVVLRADARELPAEPEDPEEIEAAAEDDGNPWIREVEVLVDRDAPHAILELYVGTRVGPVHARRQLPAEEKAEAG